MKKSLIFIVCILFLANVRNLDAQNKDSEYIINKKSGRIILAYRYFEDYLHSDRSWENFKKLVFEACPEMIAIYKKCLSGGAADSLKYQNDIKISKFKDWSKYLNRYDNKTVNYLYDSIIAKANAILPPIKKQPVDLCFFMPYSGCFVLFDNGKSTICISLYIDPKDANKIMIHEYAHCLYYQRHSEEPLSLKREIVSEGFAVYMTTLTISDLGIFNSIPFMPASSFKWCLDNENSIKDSIQSDFSDTTSGFLYRYIADGIGFSKPPKGFVEKTGYFVGYQIIKTCIDKGMKLEEICSLTSAEIIKKSGYFEN